LQDYIGEATAYDKKLMLERKDPTSWLKSVSAFANTQGGRLLFGVGDDGSLAGLADAEGDAEAISEIVKAQMDPVPEIGLAIHEEAGRRFVTVEVEAGTETPYYTFVRGHRDAYVRIGNESVKADAVQLKRLVLKGTKCSWDSLPSPHGRDTASFEVLRAVYFRCTKRKFSENDFVSFGLVAGDGRLTNAGALFADGPLVRHSRVFCTRWNGLTKAHGTLEARDDDEFSGGLLTLLESAKGFVKANSKSPWRKLPSGEGRVDYPEYPPDAVEECIVNALIHRDYLEPGSEVHIDIFDDRLEVYSPGGMPSGERIQDLDVSYVPSARRNPVIADLFQRLDLMERRGSGFGKILEAYRRESEKRGRETIPSFRSSATSFFVVLPNLNRGAGGAATTTATATATTTATATAAAGWKADGSVAEMLGKDTARVYRLISLDGRITAGDIAGKLHLSESGVRYHLKKIKMAGLARYEGNAMSGGRWVVVKG
jgi:predicted HTH transcriptional regulator